MNELEARIVLKYIDEYLSEPIESYSTKGLGQRSYSRWAAYEIIERLMEYPFNPPDEIVEAFIIEMTGYSYMAKDPRTARIFEIAMDTAEDILCLLA